VEAAAFANMADEGANAKIVEAAAFANMADEGANAKIVEAAAFANMADEGANARIARSSYRKKKRLLKHLYLRLVLGRNSIKHRFLIGIIHI
jgi:hypothetical protein